MHIELISNCRMYVKGKNSFVCCTLMSIVVGCVCVAHFNVARRSFNDERKFV